MMDTNRRSRISFRLAPVARIVNVFAALFVAGIVETTEVIVLEFGAESVNVA